MKKSLPASGRFRCSSLGSMLVCAPKYTLTFSPIISSPSSMERILIAEASSKKDTIMREKDFRGAQEWMGALVLMSSRIVWRLSARKTIGSLRLVIISVFEGGVGCVYGGIEERSIESGVLDREVGLSCGELCVDIMMVC